MIEATEEVITLSNFHEEETMWKKILGSNVILIAVSLSAMSLSGTAIGEDAAQADTTDWQMQQLYHPSKGLLRREQHGLVTIYDGLTDVQVNRILDRSFPRIGSMMFTRVRTTDSQGQILRDALSGTEIVEDDGCDE